MFAEQVLGMFESGISSALVFFAPRRMGKTEFLCKDITPLAESRKWCVFYFSFLDVGKSASRDFTKSLINFAQNRGALGKAGGLLKRISKISGEAGGVKADLELRDPEQAQESLKDVISKLCKKQKILLLMDEVQTLAQDSANANFIASFRTILDLNKSKVKVIFTGSSQEGLRRMFSQSKAPFFHFGLNLPFPELERDFTDHLAQIFSVATKREINKDALWKAFIEMQKVPQLARSLVERIALNPSLSIYEAKKQLLSQVFEDSAFINIWDKCSALEKIILRELAVGENGLFSSETMKRFEKEIGVTDLKLSSVQSSVRVLTRKGLIGRNPDQRGYYIDDPNFKNWLLQYQ
ncbi:MAG: ATP-binding protein [Gammaproteobacteria bacterium]